MFSLMYTKMAEYSLFFPSDNLFFPVLFFMLRSTYYSQNYASIIRQGLSTTAPPSSVTIAPPSVTTAPPCLSANTADANTTGPSHQDSTVSVPFAIGAFARMEKSGLGVPVAAGYTSSVWRMFSWMTTVKKDFSRFG